MIKATTVDNVEPKNNETMKVIKLKNKKYKLAHLVLV